MRQPSRTTSRQADLDAERAIARPTTEVELLAHDALNPGFGYSLRVLIDGDVAREYHLTDATARKIMRDAVATARADAMNPGGTR